jgi:hypothetical protein
MPRTPSKMTETFRVSVRQAGKPVDNTLSPHGGVPKE